MVVSRKNRYVFVAVPHTACTAIRHELLEHYDGEDILFKHANYSQFLAQASPEERDYFAFAAVRHPLDVVVTKYSKLVSNHKDHYTQPAPWVTPYHLEQYRYVHSEGATFEGYVRRFYRSVYHEWFLMLHQQMDFVMRFERIADDFEAVLRRIGIEPVRRLPVVNRTARKREFLPMYPPSVHQHCARIFGPAMEHWGYGFPEDWSVQRAPGWSRLRYQAEENVARVLAPLAPLSHGGALSRALLQVRKLTRRTA